MFTNTFTPLRRAVVFALRTSSPLLTPLLKEAMQIKWENPPLDQQLNHVNLPLLLNTFFAHCCFLTLLFVIGYSP